MNSRFTQLVATFAVATIVLVSLFSVCERMLMVCDLNCSQQTMSHQMAADSPSVCLQGSSGCTSAMADHMTTFSWLYPSITTPSTSLFFLVAVTFLLAISLERKHDLDSYEKWKVVLKTLRQRVFKSVAPDFLIVAFRRGILNAKLYV